MKVVEKINGTAKESEYPCLKIYKDGLVVLFTGWRKGYVLKSINTESYSIGYYSDSWYEEGFNLYSGTLEISNE